MLSRNEKRLTRQRRTRAGNVGTAKRPRVSLFKSQSIMNVQLIDDEKGTTLVFGDSKKESEPSGDESGKKFDIASCERLGEKLAKDAIKKGINEVVFDRSGYRYHGKIKAVADGLRKGGLKL